MEKMGINIFTWISI